MSVKIRFVCTVTLGLLLVGGAAISAETPVPSKAVNSPPKSSLCQAPSDKPALAADRRCPYFGHTWTREDIERTGALTVADALRELDPSVMIVHH